MYMSFNLYIETKKLKLKKLKNYYYYMLNSYFLSIKQFDNKKSILNAGFNRLFVKSPYNIPKDIDIPL